MKASIILFLLFVCVFFSALKCKAQEHYYFYKGEKISLDINEDAYYITMSDTSNFKQKFLNSKLSISEIKHGVNQDKGGKGYWKIINIKNNTLSKQAKRDWLISNSQIKHVQLVIGNKYSVALSEYFYIKLKEIADTTLLNKIMKEKLCKVIGPVAYMPLWYSVQVPEKSNTLDVSNSLYSSKYFQEVDPGFIFDFSHQCISDPLFNQQWALQNSNSGIQACSAWNVTRGNATIRVAVVDQGIDLTHQEFSTNIIPMSYNAQTNSQNAQVYGEHATHVAGIIGANQNGIQISGIAPQTSLMNICHSLNASPTISQELASGISYAWQNGASVINNSWGDQGGSFYNNLHSVLLEDAINNAITNGRNGLGCIVVFAAGNFSPVIDYPAYYRPEILCVGSTNDAGHRSTYSGYGTSLDVVAPGENILSTLPNNETGFMSGTSMATPYVSGVAALILSINPFLTRSQVSDIIELTCTKVGNYNYSSTSGRNNGTWNNEVGYGLINAFAAVQAVPKVTISGPSQICDQGTYTVNNLPAGATVAWSSSNTTIATVVGSGSTATLTGVGNGNVTLSATINNSITVTKDIGLGVPSRPLGILNFSNGDLLGNYSVYDFALNYVGDEGVNQFNWTVTGGTILSGQGTNTIEIRTAKRPKGAPNYVFDVNVKVGNACGWSNNLFVTGFVTSGSIGPAIISLAPNPSSDQVEVSISDAVTTNTLLSSSTESQTAISYQISVVDSNGNVVYSTTKKEKMFNIQTSSFRNGVYAVIISDGINVYQNKLIVKH